MYLGLQLCYGKNNHERQTNGEGAEQLPHELALQAEQAEQAQQGLDLAHAHHQHAQQGVMQCSNCGQHKLAADFQQGGMLTSFCASCYAEAEQKSLAGMPQVWLKGRPMMASAF